MFDSRCLAESSRSSTRRSGRFLRRSVAVAAVAVLTVSACSSDDDAQEPVVTSVEATDAAPDTTTEGEGVVEVEPAGLQQNGPIGAEGAPLDPYDNSVDDPAVGAQAPVVRGESFDGSEILIGAPTDRPTMVVFLAHWCGHCNAEVPVLTALEEEGRIPEGLDVVGVSTAVDSDGENYPPSEWIADRGWPWPTMADDESQSAIAAFGGTAFPFTVVLDADGKVLARRAGESTGDETVEFIQAALADA